MKRVTVTILLSALFVLPAAHAQCVSHPATSFAGRVQIPYPKGGGTASVVRVCGPEAARITQELTAQGKKLNTNVRWVEVYRVRRWQSAFHDSIYQLRTQGFKQDTYRKFQLQGWDDAETLVYTNSAGKYVGMISRGTSADGSSSIFALYGN
ncbi:hypothetical protein [Deinococcus hopiensis]|uniref:Uncharacterized protein n=1 Tax=Deinococcus hopiensis KR-140 TaxID=695939 RepID=A0A1W1UY44_9DEIO|nr:hypothetical protein [Deinococcus hopiensis]SMB86027.1 hypothetical protein SAMN00790413_03652 [Deinococcus hopiensis KR-140]